MTYVDGFSLLLELQHGLDLPNPTFHHHHHHPHDKLVFYTGCYLESNIQIFRDVVNPDIQIFVYSRLRCCDKSTLLCCKTFNVDHMPLYRWQVCPLSRFYYSSSLIVGLTVWNNSQCRKFDLFAYLIIHFCQFPDR